MRKYSLSVSALLLTAVFLSAPASAEVACDGVNAVVLPSESVVAAARIESESNELLRNSAYSGTSLTPQEVRAEYLQRFDEWSYIQGIGVAQSAPQEWDGVRASYWWGVSSWLQGSGSAERAFLVSTTLSVKWLFRAAGDGVTLWVGAGGENAVTGGTVSLIDKTTGATLFSWVTGQPHDSTEIVLMKNHLYSFSGVMSAITGVTSIGDPQGSNHIDSSAPVIPVSPTVLELLRFCGCRQ